MTTILFGLIIFIVFYAILSFSLKIYAKEKYKYRVSNRTEWFVDVMFVPFMELVSNGKDAHWWDWESIPENEVDQSIKQLQISSSWPQKRKYINWPLVGSYNPYGLWDLYLTLRVLPSTAIIKPVDFHGEWSLVIRGLHSHGEKETYIRSKYVQRGKVKNLIDGTKHYLGVTKDGKFIQVELVEICPRNECKEILFV